MSTKQQAMEVIAKPRAKIESKNYNGTVIRTEALPAKTNQPTQPWVNLFASS